MSVFSRLTLKNLRLNKSRTVVTIIGIILSAALIMTVAGMVTATQQMLIDAEINSSGDYELELNGVRESDIEDLNTNRKVNAVYVKDETGFACIPEIKNDSKPYLYIEALSAEAFTDCFYLPLEQGRYPQNSDEIVLSDDAVKSSESEFAIGDTITLEVGSRVDGSGNLIDRSYGYAEYMTEDIDSSEETEEYIDVEQTKTYTVVGILSDSAGSNDIVTDSSSACSAAITLADVDSLSDNAVLYVDFTGEGEKDYYKTVSQITGLSESAVIDYADNDYSFISDEEEEEFNQSCNFDDFKINTSLLRYKGFALSDSTLQMIYTLAAVIIVIIILASVFVIRNSFAVSITEKTKLYGMLSSVGATSKQIKRNVLFEGFVLGIIGIPLGILLGIGAVFLLVVILNLIMSPMLNYGVTFTCKVPVFTAAAAVIVSAVTILLSSLSPAIRASKTPPITAIRSNKDIKVGKRSNDKSYRSPKFVKMLFGMGGDIAYKNLKRSKKKYRTTVISIVVSVTLFISISAFTDYMSRYTSAYYQSIDYNITVAAGCDSAYSDTLQKQIGEVKALAGTSKYEEMYYMPVSITNVSDRLTDEATKYSGIYFDDGTSEVTVEMDILCVNDELYKSAVNALGYDYDEVKNKGIIYNNFYYYDDNHKLHTDLKMFDIKNGFNIKGYVNNGESAEFEIEVDCVETCPEVLSNAGLSGRRILVSKEWYTENIQGEMSYVLSIDSDDPDTLARSIDELGYADLWVENLEETARQYNSIILIMDIFVYGFITVISLIGITNIFNTVTTNMKLRSSEFAMLKSIGMTKREFNRMIRLESVFYSAKALLIGIPLGILGGIAVFAAFREDAALAFVFPWKAILISIAFVFIMVLMIMSFSMRRVRRQNIIETIRNDNI